MKANGRVLLALFEAAVVESGMRDLTYGHADSIGVLQIRVGFHTYRVADSVRLSARWFLSQAIRAAPRYSSAGRLAQGVQRSAFPLRYDQVEGTARAWIRYLKSVT